MQRNAELVPIAHHAAVEKLREFVWWLEDNRDTFSAVMSDPHNVILPLQVHQSLRDLHHELSHMVMAESQGRDAASRLLKAATAREEQTNQRPKK